MLQLFKAGLKEIEVHSSTGVRAQRALEDSELPVDGNYPEATSH